MSVAEPAADLAAQLGPGHLGRVEAEQAHAAQDEWQHVVLRLGSRRGRSTDHAVTCIVLASQARTSPPRLSTAPARWLFRGRVF